MCQVPPFSCFARDLVGSGCTGFRCFVVFKEKISYLLGGYS